MKNILRLFIVLTMFVSCDNKTNNVQSGKTQLDSLINFDTLKVVSLYGPEPKFANEQPLDDKILILSETMFMDSTTLKWATEPESINKFKRLFPKLTKADNQYWDSTNFNVNELLLIGKNSVHNVTWYRGKKDSVINFDGVIYKTDKVQLKKAWSNFDRQIIIKEIYKKDTSLYDLTDFYNNYYILQQDPDRPRNDKMFIYVLK